ncbi:Fic family protein [Dasania marina]|uniref:Fic family protein n=1 Tax=Dasania marina TaxID=471499 RepID=UPI0030D6F098|tara:strand:- start:51813 stop:52778 length:966 start_codon:yes stop_codon:yes gene_type:complete
MTTPQLPHIRALSFSLPQAQQLASLKYQQGRYAAQACISPDWLASLTRHSDQQADLLLSTLTLDGIAFNYQQAITFSRSLHLAELSATQIQQLHQQLHPKGGQWRSLKLTLPLRHQSGQQLVIASHSNPVAESIELALQQLRGHIAAEVEPLIAIPVFIYDLLQLFPFLNGNRRIALLLLRELLIEQGHEVLQYQSMEALILRTDPQLYTQLYACSRQQAPLQDWLMYYWQLLQQCYQGFEQACAQNGISNKRGSKTQLIQQTLASFEQPFSLSELQQQLPSIGPDMIRKVVRDCRKLGLLQSTGRGRAAKWIYNHGAAGY